MKLGIFIPRDMIFYDLAISGVKKHRDGIDQLTNLLKKKKVGTLLLFATNRVFRKRYRTLEFVDTAINSWGIRCIFVKNGIDTDDKARWKQLLNMQATMDEFYVTAYVENIRSAQEGLFRKLYVFGTISFGYCGEPVPGEFTNRKRPRRRLAIDKDTSEIVKDIFNKYVNEHWSLERIVQYLNDRECPLPPRCTTGLWSDDALLGVLKNPRYRGLWQYGVKEAVYLPDKDYTRQRLRRAAEGSPNRRFTHCLG